MVIDDDAPSVDALRFMLESAGHRVESAEKHLRAVLASHRLSKIAS